MNRWLLDLASRLFVWALTRDLMETQEPDRVFDNMTTAEVRRLAWREITAIRVSIIEHYRFQDREQRILTERLKRRYDLGQALNESAQRAIADKQTVVPPGYPTELQKRALELQAQTLKDRIARS